MKKKEDAKRVKNINLRNASFRWKNSEGVMETSACDGEGTVLLPTSVADALVKTPGWSLARAPRKPAEAVKLAPAPDPEDDEEEPGEDAEDDEEAEETEEDEEEETAESEGASSFADWSYADLVAEVKRRIEANPDWETPASKSKEDIITALNR